MARREAMARSEEIEAYGRHFTFQFTPRPDLRRVEVQILEGWGAAARPYVRVPVRGRDEGEARDHAIEVLRNYAGLDRYLGLVRQVALTLAPDARVEVEENALEIRVELAGHRRLRTALTLVRQDALDPERTDEELLTFIRAHLETYLEDHRP